MLSLLVCSVFALPWLFFIHSFIQSINAPQQQRQNINTFKDKVWAGVRGRNRKKKATDSFYPVSHEFDHWSNLRHI